jgi:hypothetical protein
MPRQRWLPLGEVLEELWERFPSQARRQVVKLYARLMARAAGLSATHSTQEEVTHEPLTNRSAQQDSL